MPPVHIYIFLTGRRSGDGSGSRYPKTGWGPAGTLGGGWACPVWGEPPEYGVIAQTEQLSLCRLFVKSALALGEQCAYKESAAC